MIKFFCDRNVYRLAKHLRFAGFDTMTREELSMMKIDSLCVKDRRVFITRNKHLRGFTAKAIVLDSICVYEQIKAVLERYEVNKELISTRCIRCNVKLKVSRNEHNSTTPYPSSLEGNCKTKKYCSRCGRLYWQGTHYFDMLKKITFDIK